jgi:hypothetical protein
MTLVSWEASDFLQRCVDEERAKWTIQAVKQQAVEQRGEEDMRYFWRVTIYKRATNATDVYYAVANDDSTAKVKAFVDYLADYPDEKPDVDDLDIFVEQVGKVREAPKAS